MKSALPLVPKPGQARSAKSLAVPTTPSAPSDTVTAAALAAARRADQTDEATTVSTDPAPAATPEPSASAGVPVQIADHFGPDNYYAGDFAVVSVDPQDGDYEEHGFFASGPIKVLTADYVLAPIGSMQRTYTGTEPDIQMTQTVTLNDRFDVTFYRPTGDNPPPLDDVRSQDQVDVWMIRTDDLQQPGIITAATKLQPGDKITTGPELYDLGSGGQLVACKSGGCDFLVGLPSAGTVTPGGGGGGGGGGGDTTSVLDKIIDGFAVQQDANNSRPEAQWEAFTDLVSAVPFLNFPLGFAKLAVDGLQLAAALLGGNTADVQDELNDIGHDLSGMLLFSNTTKLITVLTT